ncbi:alcohol dehydrogenase 1 [Megachile rotundata]|uniref:alcohol dehydrogenase 1 n=1 Tax=Megachile rotundata TaxID=143995 RepID=UPI003FD325FC
MLSRRVTSLLIDIVSKNSRNPWTIKRCRFHVNNMARRKKKNKMEEGMKIIRPPNCDDLPKPILEPCCKNILIIGGSEGFGFAAADHLLCKGACNVVIADDDCEEGLMTAEKLCNSYGKGRAQFIHCDIRSHCQFEAGLRQAFNKLKKVDVVFNNLDKKRLPLKCGHDKKKNENYTARTIRMAMKLLGKNHGGSGGTIISCASIFGFLGWPQDPFPIYCRKEPVIEVTMDFADENRVEDTGVRLIAVCPTDKLFAELGLPDIPESIPNKKTCKLPQCIPTEKHQIGPALTYILAWAENGSTWVVESAISVHKIPRLIHFPKKEGEKVDPKVYEAQNCPVRVRSPCVDTSMACKLTEAQSCNIEKKSKKK